MKKKRKSMPCALRLPPPLLRALDERALSEGRTRNNAAVRLLSQALGLTSAAEPAAKAS